MNTNSPNTLQNCELMRIVASSTQNNDLKTRNSAYPISSARTEKSYIATKNGDRARVYLQELRKVGSHFLYKKTQPRTSSVRQYRFLSVKSSKNWQKTPKLGKNSHFCTLKTVSKNSKTYTTQRFLPLIYHLFLF